MKWFLSPMSLFALATIIPVGLIGAAALFGGIWVWLALLYLTALSAGLDEAIHHITPPAPDIEFPVANALSVTLAIAHFVLMVLIIHTLANGAAGMVTKTGLFIAAGLFFGQVSNANAHELIHRGHRNLHRLGKWVYISLLFGHHTSAHVLIHHRYVATREDPNTSRLGESYYRFVIRAWRGSFRKGLKAEAERHARINGNALGHPYFTYVGGSVLCVIIAAIIGGGTGVITYIALASFATSQLLLSDYVQHYGLMRQTIGGRPEPVGVRHSWNSPHWFSSSIMLNAPRHSDHHAHPSIPYPSLGIPEGAPMLPRSLPAMATLALFPRRWRRVMDPLAKQWAAPPQGQDG